MIFGVNRALGQNPKFEAPKRPRGPKQIQMDKNKCNVPNGKDGIHCFGFSDFEFTLSQFVSIRGASFDIRISDLPLWGLFRSAGPLSDWVQIQSQAGMVIMFRLDVGRAHFILANGLKSYILTTRSRNG